MGTHGGRDAEQMPAAAAAGSERFLVFGFQELCRVGPGTPASRGASPKDYCARMGAAAGRALTAPATEESGCVFEVPGLNTVIVFLRYMCGDGIAGVWCFSVPLADCRMLDEFCFCSILGKQGRR